MLEIIPRLGSDKPDAEGLCRGLTLFLSKGSEEIRPKFLREKP